MLLRVFRSIAVAALLQTALLAQAVSIASVTGRASLTNRMPASPLPQPRSGSSASIPALFTMPLQIQKASTHCRASLSANTVWKRRHQVFRLMCRPESGSVSATTSRSTFR